MSKVVVGVTMKKEFIQKPGNLICDPSNILRNGVFQALIGSLLRCAQNSELKIGKLEGSHQQKNLFL